MRDFAGRFLTGARFASRYGVYLTPTLLFLGPDGRELSRRIVGINTPELFGWYLDKAIDEARGALAEPRADEPAVKAISGNGTAIFSH